MGDLQSLGEPARVWRRSLHLPLKQGTVPGQRNKGVALAALTGLLSSRRDVYMYMSVWYRLPAPSLRMNPGYASPRVRGVSVCSGKRKDCVVESAVDVRRYRR